MDEQKYKDLKITSGFKTIPIDRTSFFNQHGELWMKNYRKQCGVWPYWRVHDKLYDLSSFTDKHPGGKYWLKVTQGIDITECFESFHFTEKPEEILEKYYVKDATSPRISPFTFNEDGFFRTLKRRAAPTLKNLNNGPTTGMMMLQDNLFLLFLITMILAADMKSSLLMVASGLFLTCSTNCAHNFIHQKDNWRMYMFDFSLMSSQDFRATHAISHHIFPNTIYDYAISVKEPFLIQMPYNGKNKLISVLSSSPLNLSFFVSYFVDYIRRWIFFLQGKIYFDISLFIQPILILIISYCAHSMWTGIKLWIVLQTSFTYLSQFFITNIGNHHHSKNAFIESEDYIKDKDWGLFQIATTITLENENTNENTIKGILNLFRIRVSFGYHAEHHLFPTIDQSLLPRLQKILVETCKDFGLESIRNKDTYTGFYWRCVNNKPSDVYYEKFKNFER